MIFSAVTTLGSSVLHRIESLGRAAIYLFQALQGWPSLGSARLLIKQLYSVGVLTVPIIIVSGLFIGMVIALQGYTNLQKFGAEQALGQVVALSLLRELGPVVSALLFAGRAGSSLTAEIGLMKATEQLASMEMIGVDPLRRIVRPRLLAGFIALPLLAQLFNTVGVLGGVLVGVEWLGVYEGSFWANMQDSVELKEDILGGMFKAIVFAVVVTWIAVAQGYETEPTATGISMATTRTVVYGSLAVLGMDFLLTALLFGGIG